MAACLKPGGRNHVYARLLQGNRFVHGGRRSNQCDSLAAELIQNLFGGNAINKAEYGNPFVQENLHLIFETNRFVLGDMRACLLRHFQYVLPAVRGCDGMPLPSRSKAPSSSIETHRFIANGFGVRALISRMTLRIASGFRP